MKQEKKDNPENKSTLNPKEVQNATYTSGSYDTQNLAHNIKKEPLGPNTKR